MPKKIDLTGKVFERLTVIRELDTTRSGVRWECRCECGKVTKVLSNDLRSGKTLSCGCYKIDIHRKIKGESIHSSRIYRIWEGMNQRCYNKNHTSYYNYGGRGISICNEWKDSATFYDWAINNGYEDELTIDRIDNNGNYCPDNCRWITRKEQLNNKRTNKMITYNNKTQTISQWANELEINKNTIRKRIRLGWSIEDVLHK